MLSYQDDEDDYDDDDDDDELSNCLCEAFAGNAAHPARASTLSTPCVQRNARHALRRQGMANVIVIVILILIVIVIGGGGGGLSPRSMRRLPQPNICDSCSC